MVVHAEVPTQYLLSHSAPCPRTLVDVIYETAARFPDAEAIDDGIVQRTYAQLIGDIEDGVARLTEHGVGRGDRVGIRMPSGKAALYVTILATMAAGAAYVPVDADDPDERAELVFREAGTVAVVTEAGVSPGVGSGSGSSAHAPSTSDDAWIIFTSGSTGTPKAVAVTHRSAAAFVDAEARIFLQDKPIGPGDRVLAGLSVAFDASCEEMWLAWRHGACLVPAPRSLVRGMDLAPWLIAREVTVVSTVPTLASSWAAEALEAVRLLILGGEACPQELARRLAADGREVWNTYGPTETTVVACASRIDGLAPVSIGLPLAGCDLAVVGEDGEPIAYGATGELVIGGVGLARYLDVAKDSERFAPMPALGWNRAYRTGDLVRLEPDGLYFCGRADDQVKIGGRRIELGEIDSALMDLPGVCAGAAAVRRTANGTALLAGYVVCTNGEFDVARARALLSERLPSAMVPRLVRIDALPTHTSGKVDRGALPWPPASSFEARRDVVAPRDEAEAALASIWRETLGIEAISVTDDVFEIGADSLLVAQISILAREAGYALTPRDLYEHPTLESLARHARTAEPAAINLDVPQGDSPLSPMQQYYFTWARPNPNKFNLGFIAGLAKPLDQEILQEAFRVVIERHPVLGQRFHRGADGEFRQRHGGDEASVRVPIHRIALPEGSVEARVAFIQSEVTRLDDSLDIVNGPTIAVGLFEEPPGSANHENQENQFFLTMHQLISDAVSLDVILEDLRTVYAALSAGQEPALPARTMPFHQWVDRLIEYARGPATAQWDYWVDRARDAVAFPEDDENAVALQRDIDVLGFQVLSADEVDEVRASRGGSFHATLIHAVVAALLVTAHRMSGQRNLVLHKTAHGRETCIPGTDVSRTVGWFVTHTPITVRLPDGPADGPEYLARVLDDVAEQYRAIPDNGLAHSALRYFSDDPRVTELARFDEVKLLFNYLGDVWESGYDGAMFRPPLSAALMDIPDANAPENRADYHKHVYAYLRDGSFRIDLFYTRPNHRRQTVGRIAALFTEIFRGMLLRS